MATVPVPSNQEKSFEIDKTEADRKDDYCRPWSELEESLKEVADLSRCEIYDNLNDFWESLESKNENS